MDNKDNILEFRYNKWEIILRWAGIFITGLGCAFIFQEYPVSSIEFIKKAVLSIARAGILWYGSEFIVNFITNRIPIFAHPWRNLLSLIGSLLVFVIIVESIDIWLQTPLFGKHLTMLEKYGYYVTSLLITFFITTIYAAAFFFVQWKENLVRNANLERLNMEAKYESLKNQVNPHFLFNSLNTLLSMVDDETQPAAYIKSLSEFLRYILKSSEKELVLLRDELKFTMEYGYLQKSRFGEKLNIESQVSENYFHYSLPPLTIQILVENAIKHNIISQDKPLRIKIEVNGNRYLVVKNNLQKKQADSSTGLGLQNLKKRFAFLSHKAVNISQTESEFIVEIPLLESPL